MDHVKQHLIVAHKEWYQVYMKSSETFRTEMLDTGRIKSRPFCAWMESKHPEVDAVIDSLASEIANVLCTKTGEYRIKRHTRRIVLDLFIASKTDPSVWVDYPRRKQQYAKGTIMHMHKLKHGSFLAVVDALRSLKYIEHLDGDRRLGIQSSMRATTFLIDFINAQHVEPRMLHLDHAPTYLKDTEGNYIDFDETDRIRHMANRIKSLNDLLLKTKIELMLTEKQRQEYLRVAKHIPEMHRRTLYRVFNRGKFRFGGRFYGHAVQGIKSWWRQFVRINGEPVSELDFGGMHIRLLYAAIKSVPPPGDVYDVGATEIETARFQRTWGFDLRSVLKQILLVGINAKTDRATTEAVLAEIAGEGEGHGSVRLDEARRKEFRRILSGLLAKLKARHPAIAHFLCDDQGILLQRQDSDIADMILADFVKQGKPIIPIHDSFLVRECDRDNLRATMEKAWRKHVLSVEPVIEDKSHKWKLQRKTESSCGLTLKTGSHMEERVRDECVGGDIGQVG